MSATLCLTFDNLGEAAEIEMGAIPQDASLGGHVTATRAVPAILAALSERGLAATFFVEGLNAEAYPELLKEIDGAGHEVAYHAWRHEQWDRLSPDLQAANLRRGIDAFARLGFETMGVRPPGGSLGAGGLDVIRESGLAYCSPAGSGAGIHPGDGRGKDLAVLPFRWRHVDASCLLPPLAAVREEIGGSPQAIGPDAFLEFLEHELGELVASGGFAAFVLHPITIDSWFGEERLSALLDRVVAAKAAGELWAVPCRDVARHVLSHPGDFSEPPVLDATSWSG